MKKILLRLGVEGPEEGEITEEIIVDAINGRGLHLDAKVKLLKDKEGAISELLENGKRPTMEEKQAITWRSHDWTNGELPLCNRCGESAISLGYYGDDDWKKIHRGWEDYCAGLEDTSYVAKPDQERHTAVEQPDGSTFITDNVQAEMTCRCGKSKMWMHAGQISTPCPYCRRVWLAVHQRKTGEFKFVHYNVWWRTFWYRVIGRSPV